MKELNILFVFLMVLLASFCICNKEKIINENLEYNDDNNGILFHSKYLDVIDNEMKKIPSFYKNKDKKFFIIKVKPKTDLEYISFLIEEYFTTNSELCLSFVLSQNSFVLILNSNVNIKSNAIKKIFPQYIEHIEEYESK